MAENGLSTEITAALGAIGTLLGGFAGALVAKFRPGDKLDKVLEALDRQNERITALQDDLRAARSEAQAAHAEAQAARAEAHASRTEAQVMAAQLHELKKWVGEVNDRSIAQGNQLARMEGRITRDRDRGREG